MQGTLKADGKYTFAIKIPGVKKAAVINNDTWVILEKGAGDVFRGRYRPERGKLFIGAQTGNSENMDFLVEYKVR